MAGELVFNGYPAKEAQLVRSALQKNVVGPRDTFWARLNPHQINKKNKRTIVGLVTPLQPLLEEEADLGPRLTEVCTFALDVLLETASTVTE